MTDPLPLSFLVPTYNAGSYLLEAIQSVEGQLIEGDEVIIQDGGSTDGSVDAVVGAFGDRAWLTVCSEPDEGQSDALQRAMDKSTNEYMMWLNADDVVYSGALVAVRAGLKGKPDILCGRSTIFMNDGRIVRTYTPDEFTRKTLVCKGATMFTGSFAFRTELVREVGGFDASFEYGMDIDLFARLSEREPSVVYIDDVIGGLRFHDESKGGSTLWPIVREATKVRLAHARTRSETVQALWSSGLYWLSGVSRPLRHSKTYSSVRGKLHRPVRRDRALTP